MKRVIAIVCLVIFFSACAVIWHNTPVTPASSAKLSVVAGENFWGSLATQIGGSHVNITTVIADPNADPHEQAASNANARAFATADYVILNGAGYDSWGDRLLSSGGPADRRVLSVAVLIGKKTGDNPHFWYNPVYVNQVVTQITTDLSTLSPQNRSYFEQQAAQLKQSLAGYQKQITRIAQAFGGTPVAATEDIFAYLGDATKLNLISPTDFTTAVAEGNDPSTGSVAAFQQQLESGSVKLLVYNKQTVTPLTTSMQKIAENHNLPVVAISETVQPANTTFQAWMSNQVSDIKKALEQNE